MTSLTNGFYDNQNVNAQDDYALLGNLDKFSENIRYKIKSAQYNRDSSPPKQMKMQPKVFFFQKEVHISYIFC